jgi:predicted secreted protein
MMSNTDLQQTPVAVVEPAVRGDVKNADVNLKLAVGETREVSLASLGTAGFVWSYELEDNDSVLRLTRRRSDPDEAGPVGRSTAERLLITATAPGRAQIRMRQARPWEPAVAPRASFAINVEVSAN